MPDVDPFITPSSYSLDLNQLFGSAIKTKFRSLPVPGIANKKERELLKQSPMFKYMKTKHGKPHIVVTSAGHFGEGCKSAFPDFIRNAGGEYDRNDVENTLGSLKDAGCVGDLLWAPVDKNGNEIPSGEITVTTLLELHEIEELVQKQETALLLVVGPCGGKRCLRSKAELLQAILSKPYTSHAVCASRSINEMMAMRER